MNRKLYHPTKSNGETTGYDKKITDLGYTDAYHRLKKPPEIIVIIQIIAHPLDTIGRHSKQRHLMALSGTNTQEYPITFDTSTGYTLWESGLNHSVNPYFHLYIEYYPLE